MTLLVEQIESQHLAGNLVGDPSRRDLIVYVPPSYHSSTRRYPTAYLLHWFGARAIDHMGPQWFGNTLALPPIDDVFDPLIAKHRAAEMIVVMADGWSTYGCSQWVDSPVNGNFEQYLLHEVVPYVDSQFRTIPDRASRGVFGLSSGGFGAWQMGSQHPDVFGVMAVLSGDSYYDLLYQPLMYQWYNEIYPQEPNGPEGPGLAKMVYAIASCFTPHVAKPPYYVDLPIAFPSGEVIEPLWHQWLSYDPVINWAGRVENLQQLRGILLDVGAHDEFNLHWGHRLLSRSLARAGIAHQSQEHDGNHAGRAYERYQVALGWLSEVLERQEG